MGCYPESHMTLWSRDLETSRDKLKSLAPLSQCLCPRNLVGWWPKRYTKLWSRRLAKSHENHYISTTRVPMASKLGRMVTDLERPLIIKSFYTFTTWSCKVTWQRKIITYNQSTYDCKICRIITYFVSSYLQSRITLWSRGLARSQDKLKPLYLHYHSAYGYQTC